MASVSLLMWMQTSMVRATTVGICRRHKSVCVIQVTRVQTVTLKNVSRVSILSKTCTQTQTLCGRLSGNKTLYPVRRSLPETSTLPSAIATIL